MEKIALNYIHLSKNHAGGKDQVGLNLLKGFYELGMSKNMILICFDYSEQVIKKVAPDVEVITIKSVKMNNELERMSYVCLVGTFIIPKLIKKNNISMMFHLNCNNGIRKLKCKSIVLPHDIKAIAHRILANVKIPYYKYVLYKLMYAIDFKHADYIISISDLDKSEICQFYPQYINKIEKIYNPITTRYIEKSNSVNEKYICALNLQFHHKNIITLIKAFELIKDKMDHKLVLIGNVPKRVNYLKEYVQKHNLEKNIEFTGFVTDEKLYEFFSNAELYVNPTLYEGFGMTSVEAMILEVPTLISDIKSNTEVTKGLCEYYGPPENEHILAQRLLECLNKTYSKDYLHQCSNAMIEEYNYISISKKYYEFFEKVGK